MTIGEKMHQTLNSIRSVHADLKTYALETEDRQAKQMFTDFASQLEQIEQGMKNRINYIEQQEPQYKVYQQAQQNHEQQ